MPSNATAEENPPIIIDRREGWVELVINRPERRNSIIPPVSTAMTQALQEIEADDSIQAVVIRGAQGYFCSGVDLGALQAEPPPPWQDHFPETWHNLHLTLFGFEKPVIGALEKYGINAGAALAFACDVLVAGETAFLQVGEIQQGVGMPMNAAWLKLKTTEQVTARLAFYGDRINGPELVKLGLAAESTTDNEVLNRCREIAAGIAANPKGASRAIKQTLIEQRGIDDPAGFFRQAKGGSLKHASVVK